MRWNEIITPHSSPLKKGKPKCNDDWYHYDIYVDRKCDPKTRKMVMGLTVVQTCQRGGGNWSRLRGRTQQTFIMFVEGEESFSASVNDLLDRFLDRFATEGKKKYNIYSDSNISVLYRKPITLSLKRDVRYEDLEKDKAFINRAQFSIHRSLKKIVKEFFEYDSFEVYEEQQKALKEQQEALEKQRRLQMAEGLERALERLEKERHEARLNWLNENYGITQIPKGDKAN